ncbi:MAG: type 4b pilus protein PilO2 [Burkholderiaceae bacterium]|nr:type 4b pilus protein PilO2 [Burkholderiaceae bacterium]
MHSDTPLLLPVASTTLVFGLEWFPLLGGQLRRQSLRLARKYGASHLVLSGEQAGSVGMASLRKLRPGRTVPLQSAAQSLASLFPQGTVAVILPLQEHGWWLAAVHEGAVVVRTDRVYVSLDQAQAALSDLRVAYPQLRDLTQDAGTAPSLHDLQASGAATSLLHKVSRWHSVLPMPVQLLALALTMVAVAPPVWKWSQAKGVQPQVQAQPDTQLAWELAIRQATHARCLHGLQGTQPVLNSLYELPVAIAGWHLAQVECSAGRSAWMCQGDYQRRNQIASNDGFLRLAPSLWTSRFPTLDLAKVTWTVAATCTLFSSQSLQAAAHNEQYLFSAWQAIRPAFSRMEAGQPQTLPVNPPRDNKGQALVQPIGLTAPLYREVHIQGPLRSFELLLPHIASVEWRRLVLSLNEAIKPTLKNSQLNVTFQGVLYENESLPTRQVRADDDAPT